MSTRFITNPKSYYDLYPISCFSCGGNIACFVPKYHDLIDSEYSPEQALNELRMRDDCCRYLFTRSSPVYFDMERRDVIIGIKTINQIDINDNSSYASRIINKNLAQPVLSSQNIDNKFMEPVPVTHDQTTKFNYPTAVGYPTYNPDPSNLNLLVNVGEKKQCEILSGRTYLAR